MRFTKSSGLEPETRTLPPAVFGRRVAAIKLTQWTVHGRLLHATLVAAVQSVTNDNFGPLIAYLVPGAVALAGFSPFSATLGAWFASAPADAPSIGGFLYLTVASLAAGMTVSAVRWAVIDTLHARTGLPPPKLDFSLLGGNVEAFVLLIEIHYRHYQFYA